MNFDDLRYPALSFLILLATCSKSPFDRTKDASGGGALGKYGVVGSMVIFSDELKTGGGAFEYPGGENQMLAFNDRSNPLSERSIRYSWSGQPVSNPGGTPNPEIVFAGFDLMHVTSLSAYASTPGRNLQGAGYTKVTFYARGSLSTFTVAKIEVSEPSSPSPACWILSTDGRTPDPESSPTCMPMLGTLSSNWQPYTIPLTKGNQATIKDFFKVTFIYTNPVIGNTQPGQGGTIYVDEIYYQP